MTRIIDVYSDCVCITTYHTWGSYRCKKYLVGICNGIVGRWYNKFEKCETSDYCDELNKLLFEHWFPEDMIFDLFNEEGNYYGYGIFYK